MEGGGGRSGWRVLRAVRNSWVESRVSESMEVGIVINHIMRRNGNG